LGRSNLDARESAHCAEPRAKSGGRGPWSCNARGSHVLQTADLPSMRQGLTEIEFDHMAMHPMPRTGYAYSPSLCVGCGLSPALCCRVCIAIATARREGWARRRDWTMRMSERRSLDRHAPSPSRGACTVCTRRRPTRRAAHAASVRQPVRRAPPRLG